MGQMNWKLFIQPRVTVLEVLQSIHQKLSLFIDLLLGNQKQQQMSARIKKKKALAENNRRDRNEPQSWGAEQKDNNIRIQTRGDKTDGILCCVNGPIDL